MPHLQILNSVGHVRPPKTSEPDGSAKPTGGNGSSPGKASSSNQPQPYKDAPSGKILEILRVRNRFDMMAGDPHWSGGFRDLAFKVKVGFQVLPVDAASSSAPRTVATLQQCARRSPRVEHLSLCQCTTSCMHAAVVQSIAAHLTSLAVQEPLGRTLS